MPALFRRRTVWLPTAWGGLCMVALLAAAALGAALGMRPFLAVDQPLRTADGRGARVLVIEGWLSPADLDQAIAALGQHRYERILTSGGPITGWSAHRNYAERAADYLRAHGVDASLPVDAVPAPATAQDRTFASAVRVRDWARQAGLRLDSIDVYTLGVHARRTRSVYRLAFGDAVAVGVYGAQPTEYDAVRWWTTSEGVKTLLGEAISLAWTTCCFWPGPPGSHEERWAVPPR